MKVKAASRINEDSILANFNLIWEQQMVWLIESTFQFSGKSNFLNERAPLGTQTPHSEAVKRLNCSQRARTGGGGQLELSEMLPDSCYSLRRFLSDLLLSWLRDFFFVCLFLFSLFFFLLCLDVGSCSFESPALSLLVVRKYIVCKWSHFFPPLWSRG